MRKRSDFGDGWRGREEKKGQRELVGMFHQHDSLLDLLSHGQEGLLDIGGILGTRLQHARPNTLCKLLGHTVLDDFFIGQIALVAHEEFVDPLAGIAINFLEPLLDVGEGVGVGYVVDDNDAVCASVVGGGDGAESLLAGGVPLLFVDREEEGGSVGQPGDARGGVRWDAMLQFERARGKGSTVAIAFHDQSSSEEIHDNNLRPNPPFARGGSNNPPKCVSSVLEGVTPEREGHAGEYKHGQKQVSSYSTTLVEPKHHQTAAAPNSHIPSLAAWSLSRSSVPSPA